MTLIFDFIFSNMQNNPLFSGNLPSKTSIRVFHKGLLHSNTDSASSHTRLPPPSLFPARGPLPESPKARGGLGPGLLIIATSNPLSPGVQWGFTDDGRTTGLIDSVLTSPGFATGAVGEALEWSEEERAEEGCGGEGEFSRPKCTAELAGFGWFSGLVAAWFGGRNTRAYA